MMNPEERRRFVSSHRTCIYGFQRRQGPPSMSVVYYVMDGDDILVSTMAARAKARAARRSGEASLCVLDEKWPLTYMQVLGPVVVDEDMATSVDVMMKVAAIMSGSPCPKRPAPSSKRKPGKRDVW